MGERYPSDEPSELVRLVRVLFTRDADGDLVGINEDDGPRAPMLYVAWSQRGMLWRVREDVTPALAARIGEIVDKAPVHDALMQPPAYVAELRAVLAEAGPITDENAGIEYEFPEQVALPEGVVAITTDDIEVLERWMPSWRYYATIGLPMTAILHDGAAVAVCACVRRPDGATQAGLETHPAFRGHGHAAAVTAAWARAVRERGLVPLYGTSWSNQASQRVAAKLGLRPYAGSMAFDSKPR